jgi:hypothetical protein
VIDVAGYRNGFKRKSIVAINAALDDRSDNFKRGSLAVNAMKGIGEFNGDQGNYVDVLIATAPPDIRDQFETIARGELEIGWYPRDRSEFTNDEEYQRWDASEEEMERRADESRRRWLESKNNRPPDEK